MFSFWPIRTLDITAAKHDKLSELSHPWEFFRIGQIRMQNKSSNQDRVVNILNGLSLVALRHLSVTCLCHGDWPGAGDCLQEAAHLETIEILIMSGGVGDYSEKSLRWEAWSPFAEQLPCSIKLIVLDLQCALEFRAEKLLLPLKHVSLSSAHVRMTSGLSARKRQTMAAAVKVYVPTLEKISILDETFLY